MQKPTVAVAIYSLITLLAFFTYVSNGEFFLLIWVPLLPWVLLAFAGQLSSVLFFGYLPLYLLNASLIYWFFADKQVASVKRMAMVVVLSIIPWSALNFYHAAVCTGKFCDLAALLAGMPGILAAPFLANEDGNKVLFYFLAILINVIVYFLAIWGIGSLIKRIKSKKRSNRYG